MIHRSVIYMAFQAQNLKFVSIYLFYKLYQYFGIQRYIIFLLIKMNQFFTLVSEILNSIVFRYVIKPGMSNTKILNQLYMTLWSTLQYIETCRWSVLGTIKKQTKKYIPLRSVFVDKTSFDQLQINSYTGTFIIVWYCHTFLWWEFNKAMFLCLWCDITYNNYSSSISFVQSK